MRRGDHHHWQWQRMAQAWRLLAALFAAAPASLLVVGCPAADCSVAGRRAAARFRRLPAPAWRSAAEIAMPGRAASRPKSMRQWRGTRLRLLLRRRRRGLIVHARIRPQLRGQSGQDAVDYMNGQAANEAAERKPFGPNFSFRLAIFGVYFCTRGGARILCIFI